MFASCAFVCNRRALRNPGDVLGAEVDFGVLIHWDWMEIMLRNAHL